MDTGAGFWTRHVFVLLSSDAPFRGVHTDVVDRLREDGFPPVAARVLDVDPEMIDDLYADLIAGQWQTWRYRLVDALLGLGPAVALVCRDTAGRADPHAALAERKGYQHPTRAARGTIRRDLGAVNSIVGLLHSSDGPAESEREAGVFGLVAADAGDPDAVAAAIDHRLALAAPAVPERRDFDATLASVRARVLNRTWEELPAATRERLRAAFGEPADLGRPGCGDRLADLLGDAVPAGLAGVLRCEFTPAWRATMRLRHAVDQLARVGVRLDRWERLVLETSLHFPPLRAGGEAG